MNPCREKRERGGFRMTRKGGGMLSEGKRNESG